MYVLLHYMYCEMWKWPIKYMNLREFPWVYVNVREFTHTKSILAEILQTLNFILYSFLWLDIVPRFKRAKTDNVVMLIPLDIWRTGP